MDHADVREQYRLANQYRKLAFQERPYLGSPGAPAQDETNTSGTWAHLNGGFLIGYEYTRWWRENRALRTAVVIGDWSWLLEFAGTELIVQRQGVTGEIGYELLMRTDTGRAHELLDAVTLIAGQLAVSLDNAQLYAEFRRIADEQAALRRVATLVARGVGPDLVFAAVAEEVGALFGADAAVIVRFEPDGEATVMGGYGFEHSQLGSRGTPDPRLAMASVQATGRAARRDVDAPTSASLPEATLTGVRCAVASPIVVEGWLWGAMAVGSRRDRLPQDTEQRLADFTELVATAIANAESRAELSTSRARIVAAADQTRRRIERDLHDGAQQRLVSLALQLRNARAGVPPELDALAAELDELAAEATGALDELREIARGIHPAVLAKGGLRAALRTLARRAPIPVHLDVRAEGRLPEHVEVSAYYVVAEALTNAAKHARASAVAVEVDAADAFLRVAVRDDGAGGADFTRGTGLVGLKDRVEALGGRISLDSPRGAGTSLRVELPLTATNGGVTSRR
ncbi:MAG TPA: GAF domain-containing sensor histidine kinase [Pseudonocardia sp.]|uniref:GAF domain-containing sensor histidine kinase n=1 Tax=Pseudonocardia sp. TaxID=60912 RepID=UPI002CA3F3B7|nr:GAF domain-containing sensor histidine kinase [Pseudonocardia sp.]HTF51339.1 GAF domain-containing sensor histidine kinase [Pseudonocardia sp.]